MTIHIRVMPQGGAYGAYGGINTVGGYGGYGTSAATTALYSQALQNQKDTDSLKLQYQNALWEEKLQNTQLSTQLQYTQSAYANPYAGVAALGAVGSPYGAYAGYGAAPGMFQGGFGGIMNSIGSFF